MTARHVLQQELMNIWQLYPDDPPEEQDPQTHLVASSGTAKEVHEREGKKATS